MRFVLMLLLAAALHAEDPSSEGMKALEARRYEDAATLFAKAVATAPGDYGAHFHLALAQSLLGKDAEAITAYKKVLELKPGLYEAELNLAILLVAQKQPAAALPYLESATGKKPKEFRPRFYLAEALLHNGDHVKSEASYQAALESNPKSAASYLGLARAQARQNRLRDAATNFRKAAEADVSFKDALLELASLYDAAKETTDAIALYEQFPDDPGAQERIGTLLVEAKRYPEAITRLEKAVAKDPTAANRLALATAYRLNKDPEKALPLVEQAVTADPVNFDLRMLHGAMLRDQKKFVPAAREFYAAAQSRPDSKEAWNELAGMLILLDQFPQALAALDRVKALGGETTAHHFFRALIFDKTKQYKPALDSYQKFLAAAGGNFPDEEFQSRQRVRIIQKELSKR